MLAREIIVEKAMESILKLNDTMAQNVAYEALDAGIEPEYVIENGYYAAIIKLKEMFDEGKVFLPHIIAASDAMDAGIKILLASKPERTHRKKSKGTILIGTIEGDIHSIGKEIIATSLHINSYNVIDLGVDVPVETFVEQAIQICPDVIATSALMTITMMNQMILEKELNEAGIRDAVKTMVGGAPVTAEWAMKIGADMYGSDTKDVLTKLNAVLKPKLKIGSILKER
ncbi:methyltransferase cognate corrinoid protein [Methanolobus sp. ZRKC5]|uniref:methyltransferase cognate corrinoid protein n=1 Tax=unclassified Methanolobus TaxID=2629569 RepID=UPI00313D5266